MEYVIFSLGSVHITAFGLGAAAAAAVSVLLAYFSMQGLGTDVWAVFAAWCLPLVLVCARLFYCLANMNYMVMYGFGFAARLWNGGYAFWGAAGGSVIAGLICAKRTKLKTADVLNAAVPALLLGLALCRFAEGLSNQGYGLLVETKALQFFPFSVINQFGEWNVAVFMAEGITAMIVLLLSVRVFKTHKALKSTLLIAATQIVWESMRRDAFLRWGFVRVSQLAAVIVLFAILAVLCVRRLRAGEKPVFLALRFTAFAVLTGACIALEFAIDKSPLPYVWAWLIMAVCAAGLCALPWLLLRKPAVGSA